MTGHGIWPHIPSICGHMTVHVMLSGFQMLSLRLTGVGGCAVGALSGRVVTNRSITLRDTLDTGEDIETRSIAKDQNSLLHNLSAFIAFGFGF